MDRLQAASGPPDRRAFPPPNRPTYHEPFLGGGAVLYELLGGDHDIDVRRIECGDTCAPLVHLWQLVRDDPDGLIRHYAGMWRALRASGEDCFYEARHEFNRTGDPYLFFSLLRTCRNGLVRFNRGGEFNSGFHGARPGMAPDMVEAVLMGWRLRLERMRVRFAVRDYREVVTGAGDLLYFDPPYLNEDGQYYGGMIDLPEFFDWNRGQRGAFLLSLNGFLGDEDRTVAVPDDLYDEHLLLDNGRNPFGRLPGKPARMMYGSLYIGRRRPTHRRTGRRAASTSSSAGGDRGHPGEPGATVPGDPRPSHSGS